MSAEIYAGKSCAFGDDDAFNYIYPAVAHKQGQVKDGPIISHTID